MSFILLTKSPGMEVDYKTHGGPVLINTSNILRIEKNRQGKCVIALQGHTNYWIHVEESFEQVRDSYPISGVQCSPLNKEDKKVETADPIEDFPEGEDVLNCYLNLEGEEVILKRRGQVHLALPDNAEYMGALLESDIKDSFCTVMQYAICAVDMERKKLLTDTLRFYSSEISMSMALAGAGIIEILTDNKFLLLSLNMEDI